MIAGSVSWTPQSKERARTTKWGTYTPARTAEAEAAIVRELRRLGHIPQHPIDDPIRASIYFGAEAFYFELEVVSEAEQKGMYRDVDNMGKLVLDAMNGIMYEDDKQIVDLRLVKL